VDDILANIRKSVESELDSLSNGSARPSRGGMMRHALQEMRENMTPVATVPPSRAQLDVLDLRSRIKRKVESLELAQSEPPPAPPVTALVPRRRDFSGILAGTPQPAPQLRPSFADEDVQNDLHYAQPQWQAEEPHYDYATDHEAQHYAEHQYAPLMSPDTEAMTESSFQDLSNAILARAAGERSIEDMTRDILHGMLKQWLDENLPGIVEAIVREEIQRVARKGR
jgi:uncharacterized protein